ncbi:hypothetical protein [Nocardia sp. NPDC057668]|uniref:hypothetical protein n=1 Tax=Nocardia sp. NPDC057668 TaxID=3346202 RepID=UPI003672F4FD
MNDTAAPGSAERIRCCLALSLVLLPLLTGCSHSHDGYFENPCDKPLTIHTFYYESGSTEAKTEDIIATAVIQPLAVIKVQRAFQDAAGFTWWVQVSGQPEFTVSKDAMPEWKVSIPVSACDS